MPIHIPRSMYVSKKEPDYFRRERTEKTMPPSAGPVGERTGELPAVCQADAGLPDPPNTIGGKSLPKGCLNRTKNKGFLQIILEGVMLTLGSDN